MPLSWPLYDKETVMNFKNKTKWHFRNVGQVFCGLNSATVSAEIVTFFLTFTLSSFALLILYSES